MTNQTFLFRQVNPRFHRDGILLAPAFTPTTADEAKLSVDDGDQVEAEAAFVHFTQTIGLKSCGTWAVTCEEATLLNLAPAADPLPQRPNVAPKIPDPLPEWPSHSIIDFAAIAAGDRKTIAKVLADHAQKRGIRHPTT